MINSFGPMNDSKTVRSRDHIMLHQKARAGSWVE